MRFVPQLAALRLIILNHIHISIRYHDTFCTNFNKNIQNECNRQPLGGFYFFQYGTTNIAQLINNNYYTGTHKKAQFNIGNHSIVSSKSVNMSTLSTLRNRVYGRTWSFPYNCYEVGHGWTPYCTDAACEVGLSVLQNAIPIYSSLYLFTQLGIQRKYNYEAFKETVKSALTSSSFLAFNFFCGMSISCFLRNNSDRYYYRIQCFVPALIASYAALQIERPARRPALAFYLANMASELVYKVAATQGYVISFPHSETIVFTIGMACYLHFLRVHGFSHDPVSVALKYLIGPLEAQSRARTKVVPDCEAQQISNPDDDRMLVPSPRSGHKRSMITVFEDSLSNFLNLFFSSHPVCPHKGKSCVDYCITPTITRFALGYTIKSFMNLGGQYPLILRSPGDAFKNAFKSQSSIKFGLFVGVFVGASKAVHCIMRRISGKQEAWHSILAGGVSGLSMLFSPKSTLSTYVLWKCLEQYFFLGVRKGIIKQPDPIISMVYAISANIILYTFALEPRFIRSSYMKFMDGISDHKLHQVNRMVLDVFSKNASAGYEEWFPNLDPKYMSREFHELIFNWLIQPY